MQTSQGRLRKRVVNACQRCRKHKIKCSGVSPCRTCHHRGLECQFGSDDKKVVISEGVLKNLRRRLAELERQQKSPEPREQSRPLSRAHETHHTPSPDSQRQDLTETQYITPRESQETHSSYESPSFEDTAVENPLVPEKPAYFSEASGRLRYMGHSSTWSFSRQVLDMAYQSPNAEHSPSASSRLDGEIYRILPEPGPIFNSWSFEGLPSLDLSLYYLHTVKFRTHPFFHLFDESEFTSRLHQFYQEPETFAQTNRLWYVHYLLIMAFGKSFISQGNAQSGPAGSELFARAMGVLPDTTQLCSDPVKATEIFCCIALFLQSVDHRVAAHLYVGQAIRMAQIHGLHTDMQPNEVGEQLVHRGRCIWWTVYALDRRLSSIMGVPDSIRDEEITAKFPLIEDDTAMTALLIHFRISRLLGNVISTVYSSHQEVKKAFVATTRTVLTGIGDLAEELIPFSDRGFGEISRVSAHLNLAYHQCIILTSRPVLFYLLKQRMKNTCESKNLPLSSSIRGLLQVCIDSAVQIATILAQLQQCDLLDAFLPFDLESAFSAAFVLVMASSIHSKLLPQHDWLVDLRRVFDYISLKGNILAGMCKSEVEELTQALSGIDPRLFASAEQPATTPLFDQMSTSVLGDPFFEDWNTANGLSGAQILDLAEALEVGGLEDIWAV
ncbi:hypothetical protein EDB80DRAFT_412636 [Ilyonectria destructans]|nr:hypothetical protein EDB80DRAFT_412636 [Ilyonectria destructans]